MNPIAIRRATTHPVLAEEVDTPASRDFARLVGLATEEYNRKFPENETPPITRQVLKAAANLIQGDGDLGILVYPGPQGEELFAFFDADRISRELAELAAGNYEREPTETAQEA